MIVSQAISFPTAVEARASRVEIGEDAFHVILEDGRTISVPYELYSRLANASVDARKRFELIGKGLGIHWPELDEDISIAELLGASY